ncbi:cytosolic protein [bacterium]|nr:cytosolic protein [bacterium]
MSNEINIPDNLSSKQLVQLLFDFIHRTILHHSHWYSEIRHQMGEEKALSALDGVFKKSLPIQLNRFSKALGFEDKGGFLDHLHDLPKAKLLEWLDVFAANWLANDGIWFQEVEFDSGMNDAKRCNDSCWAQFSPIEARLIKNFLGLTEQPGLTGLKQALNFRLYGRINKQSISEETETSFVFQMNECRVQVARNRKGLDDYPCKSVGLVEYPYFAKAIDERIKTTCIGCPPDSHPQDWYCAWKFSISES